jgi:hypothetical protein
LEGDEIMTPEEKLVDMVTKWDLLVNNVNKISDVFKQVRRSFGNDIDTLQDKISMVDCRIGPMPTSAIGLEDCLNVWEGISCLNQGLLDVTSGVKQLSDNVREFEKQVADSKRSSNLMQQSNTEAITQIKRGMSDMEVLITALGEEHDLIVSQVQGGSMTTASTTIMNDSVRRLGDRIQIVEAHLANTHGGELGASTSLVTEINDLKAELKRIDARVPRYNNMMLGGQVFQSKADVELFVSLSRCGDDIRIVVRGLSRTQGSVE